jgi:2'-5' RNA ligase
MRLFTAIDVTETLVDTLAALQAPETLDAQWSNPDQFHITLRFMGDASEQEATRYAEALSTVGTPPVRCAPYGIDVLPFRRSPRVLILGLERTDSLVTLYEAVSDALRAEGLEPEDRTYRPHVTLARLDDVDREPVHRVLRRHEDRSFPSFEADHFVLYESSLTPEGAIHDPQATYSLSD